MSEAKQTNGNSTERELSQEQVDEIFNDPEAKRNLVGLYDILFKVARRNPKLWAEIIKEDHD